MKLDRFIQTNKERLLEDWEKAVLDIAPELKGQSSHALRDHGSEILDFISQDILTKQTRAESANKAIGKGRGFAPDAGNKHGIHRLQQGMSMLQMAQELRALRARVTVAWSDEQRGLGQKDIDELVRFNEAIDELLATAISSFSNLQAQVTRRLETMLTASPEPSAIVDPDGKYLYLNTAMTMLVNTSHQDAIGKTPLELSPDKAEGMQEAISTAVTTGQTQRRENHHYLPSGREVYLDCQFVPVCNEQDEIDAVIKILRDITERKQAERQVLQNANFDSLTGLPNRRLFIDRLEQILLEAQRKDSAFALLFIDLDHFKKANDRLGHKAGDRLLQQVAKRMSTRVRAMDTLARLGGDEFTLILKDTDREDAHTEAKALLASLEEAFDVNSQKVNISASIGLTCFPDDSTDVDQLMKDADKAMYVAKELGGQQVQVYDSWMTQSESEAIKMRGELYDSLSKSQLEVYYQPIVEIRTGAIAQAEALLRWNHPEKGLLTPDAFLSVTEQSGLMDRITAYVLEQAITCSLRWRDQKGEAFPISINEPPSSFVTRHLVDQWQARLTGLGLDESRITLELTPTSLNNIHALDFNPAESLGQTKLQLNLSINDFGIEPFSLSALQEFRSDSVKIDRELIKDAGQGGDADRIIEAIIAMAHTINIRVVGVGVETVEQLRFLTTAGCDYVQGFLFSDPLRRPDFEALLSEGRCLRPQPDLV